MKVSGITSIRLVCQTHDTTLKNVGNGRFIDPTNNPTPQQQSFGWMALDLSEYACPEADEVCNFTIEGTDDDVS